MFLVSSTAPIVTSADCESIDMGDLAQPHRELARPSISGYIPITTQPDVHKSTFIGRNSADPPARPGASAPNCIHSLSCRNGYYPISTSDTPPTSTVGYRLATSTCTYTPSSSRENLTIHGNLHGNPIHGDLHTSQTGFTCSTESNQTTSDIDRGIYTSSYMPNEDTLEIPHDPNGSPILVQYDPYHEMDIFVHHPLSKSVFTKEHLDRTALICGAVVPNNKLNYQDFCPSLSGLDSGITACQNTFR